MGIGIQVTCNTLMIPVSEQNTAVMSWTANLRNDAQQITKKKNYFTPEITEHKQYLTFIWSSGLGQAQKCAISVSKDAM